MVWTGRRAVRFSLFEGSCVLLRGYGRPTSRGRMGQFSSTDKKLALEGSAPFVLYRDVNACLETDTRVPADHKWASFQTSVIYRPTLDGHPKWDPHGFHQATAGGIGSHIVREIPDAFDHVCAPTTH